MFANKNQKANDDNGPNTITKMFKNAPPPKAKPKRTVDEISKDAPKKEESGPEN